jgi:ribonuclease E
LSEGNHITCPRCNGTGHIRDTESSALQILRIIQEEALKENTAAVHVQVPVEVTSFLLNEKRTEITKIELKQRVTVLLVPNRHLETPNYKLERLRHDDPRLENLQASYTMIEEPTEEDSVTRREIAKPRQEPMIKGVLPDQPAPPAPAPVPVAAPVPVPVAVVAAQPAPAPTAAGSGFFGWVSRIFGGGAPAPAPVAAPLAAPVVAPASGSGTPEKREGRRDGRGDRGGRGGDRGDRGERKGSSGRGERSDSKEARGERGGRGGERTEARSEQRSEGRDSREPRAVRVEAPGEGPTVAERDDASPRGERSDGRRGPRAERAPRAEGAAAEPNGQAAFVDSTGAAEAPAAEGGERDGRRRRRRGGRDRGEGRAEDGTAVAGDALQGVNGADGTSGTGSDLAAAADSSTAGSAPATAEDSASPAAEAADRDRGRRRRGGRDRNREGREGLDGGPDSVQPIEGEATPAAALTVATFEDGTSHAGAALDVPAPPVPEQALAGGAPAGMPASTSASTPASTPAASPVAPVAPAIAAHYVLATDALQSLAQTVGLEWVNSDADKIRAVQAAMAAEPRPIHVPREPKRAVLADEGPLVLVETRRDLSQIKLPFEHGAN